MILGDAGSGAKPRSRAAGGGHAGTTAAYCCCVWPTCPPNRVYSCDRPWSPLDPDLRDPRNCTSHPAPERAIHGL